MRTKYLVTATWRGRIHYRTNEGGWSPHRSAAREYPTHLLAQRERDVHWAHDVMHETRTESVRSGL